MGIVDKIQEIEKELGRTQKNKSTEHHIMLLKARLAKYKNMLLEQDAKKGGGGTGEGFDVKKKGQASVALIGFPSVGKSSLLTKLSNTKSEIASYAFTTLTCIPTIVDIKGAKVQLIDMPGIIEGACHGKGRGKQVISAARNCDMVLMVVEAGSAELQIRLLTKELENMGIRLNTKKPDMTFKRIKKGGIKFASTCKLTHLNQDLAKKILHEYRVFNAEILVREDITLDEFLDCVIGDCKYMKCAYCFNKIDNITIEEVDRLARLHPYSVVCSCHWDLNLDRVIDKIWEVLDFIRIYTKRQGRNPDLQDAFTLRNGSTIHQLCTKIHHEMASKMKIATVWGRSAKHQPQKVGKNHVLMEGDVVQIIVNN
ncbi:developmentally-regulated gtp-binding protein [Anaeramoeba flamelloides]|uniref:Developmentally-regulated gtp-binding protein n=1 Tax=Anaeramoeba flamelloides TaxID=1746091 RepID=A0AAV7Y7I5_9EUKA|nr:developmentally-regulated gtp-binding protein [Anaeramoeba flamelloides]KAJ6252777.1 developmentally-regulated gtp-binding protein [Anaeramoeba flamelloides]|eukprot:Anaeramoba_flamelloidesa815074_140.p1 GENE.a815074_140~~a815074_140.p1  ORF type:complete len:369 (-),score=65.74 a815074_140:161-1267(-)